LTSEAVGGRSANRGACAQACRLPYELLVDGVRRDLGDCAYLLSPQDLEASALIPDLVALKVDAVKIEGRLKGPAYVAATTLLYRRAVDAALGNDVAADPTLRPMALQTFTRGSGHGFLQGVDHQALVEGRSCDHRGLEVGSVTGTTLGRVVVRLSQPIARGDGILIEGGFAGDGEVGGRVWSLSDERGETPSAEAGQVIRVGLGPEVRIRATEGRRVWKTSDPSLERAVFAKLPEAPRRPLDLVVTANHGECARLEGIAGDVHASVQADTPIVRATSATSSLDAVKSKLARLGDTPFVLRNLELRLPSDALWPVSSINRARRALVEALVAGSHRSIPTATVSWAPKEPTGPLPPPGLLVLCRTLAQAEAALDAGADGVYLDFLGLTGTGDAFRALRARGRGLIGVAPPRVRKPGEETIDRFLADLGPDMTLVRGLGALGETSLQQRIGDFSLNVANGLAASEVLARGLTAFTPCFDLDATELVTFLDSSFGPYAELVVHHPMALFYMEHCVFAALLSKGRDSRSCGRPCDLHRIALRDRAGHEHPVMADVGCRNTVFHGSAQSAAELIPKVLASGVRRFRIELVTETQESTTCIVTTYRALLAGTVTPTEVWRTLQAQEGYGVVRGSLRVVTKYVAET
ncbi:MAG: DUF3656 domain-containing protein, partial [Myxococcales bacterium]